MAQIVLISCVSKKLNQNSMAQDMYISSLFKKSFQYALSLNPDKIFILSAKYGLINLNEEISPYNITLNNMASPEIRQWASKVLIQLRKVSDLEKDKFIFLAGANYRKFLIPFIKDYKIPLLGLGIGKQLHWLTEKIKDEQKL